MSTTQLCAQPDRPTAALRRLAVVELAFEDSPSLA